MGLITATLITNGSYSTDVDNTVFTNPSSMTFRTGYIYILKITSTGASGNPTVPTITTGATGLTFDQIGSSATILVTLKTTAIRFVPTVDTSGTITATFGATQSGYFMEVYEIAGADTRANGAYAFLQILTAMVSTSTNTIGLSFGTFSGAKNASMMMGAVQLNEDITVGGSMGELHDSGIATPARRTATGFLNANTTEGRITWATNNSNSCILIFEIVASSFPKVIS